MEKSTEPPSAANGKEALHSAPITPELRGETMAFALQSGIGNLLGNLYEPYIGYLFQQHADPAHHGTYSQNLGGELVGDVAGAAVLMGAEAAFPRQLHNFMRTARSWCDPLSTAAARIALGDECTKPGYEAKVEKWKTFQERNLVRSGIVAAAGISANIASQKLLFANPSPTSVILKGKLLSTAVSTALMLGMRLAFPGKLKQMDAWLGEQVFEPMLEEKPLNPETGEAMPSATVSKALIKEPKTPDMPLH